MSRRARRTATILVGLGAIVLSAAALAWACTPQAAISAAPGSGPSGTRVTITGTSFTPGAVRIHWGSSTGPVIGAATGPEFTTTVTIPQSRADVYYIRAVGPEGSGSASFEVTVPAGTAPAPGGGGGTTPGGGGAGNAPGGNQGATPGGNQGATPGGEQGATAPGAGGGGRTTGDLRTSGGGGGGSNTTTGRSGGGSDVTTRPRALPRDNAQTSPTPAIRMVSGRRVFGGSVASPGAGVRGSSAPTPNGASAAGRSGSPAANGAGGGVESAGSAGDRPADVASLADPAMPQAQPARSPLLLGIGLLGIGLVAMFAGFLVAVVRRRRAPARG